MGGEAGRAPSGGLRSCACSRSGWGRHHHHQVDGDRTMDGADCDDEVHGNEKIVGANDDNEVDSDGQISRVESDRG